MKLQKTFSSVWDAIENTEAESANMKVKSELMIALRDQIERMGLIQAEAAKKLGITQPRLNDLLRGRINRFSLDALFDLASRAGLEIHLKLKAA
ncbi:MAG: transcriptional regulator [Coxiella sp. RIFCSPHIGHO2_12_FULL_44_14]|nr:MAG: transcriptional regulator [Coxiella sp. RIFCSPHIGHO2_12_FULL_44_14]